jgi:glycosyltransferase involved in cell wall biosynthesis
VVIPAYNQPQMLSDALRSVQEQTRQPAEIIIVDDCSTEPLEGVTEFSPDLPVHFIRHQVNQGPAGSVVHGIRESKCELVCTLNHDDMWEPDFLERLGAELDAHPEACFAFCDHGIMRADGEHDEQLSREQSERFGRTGLTGGVLEDARLYEAAVLHKATAACSFALVRRAALDPLLIGAGADMWDYFLVVGACRAGNAAVYVPERLGWYRFSPTMLTTTWTDPRKQIEIARSQIAILLVILRSPRLESLHPAVRKRLALAIRHVLAAAVRTRSPACMGRVMTRIVAGVRDAMRLSSRDPVEVGRQLPVPPRGLSSEA